MGMTVDTSGADEKLQNAIQALSPQQRKKLWRKASRMLLRVQRERIESGVGEGGSSMRPYSPSYAAFRASKGRQTSVRTLVFTGQMLGSRKTVKATPQGAILGWSPGFQAEKAVSNQARTPFTGPTREEREKLVRFIRRQLKRGIQIGRVAA